MTEPKFEDFDRIDYYLTGMLGESHTKIVYTNGKKPGDVYTDGSSFGMKTIFKSDVRLEPDWETFYPSPFSDRTGGVYCNIFDKNGPIEYSTRDILRKATIELTKEGGYTYKTGAELEFFLLPLDEKNNPIFEFSDKGRYFGDLEEKIEALSQDVKLALEISGINAEAFHHEVAKGQYEVSFQFDDALRTADNIQSVKRILRKLAKREGLYPTFMPKPFFGENGSGMHVHQSLATEKNNAFADGANISELAKQFIAGQISHARGLAAAIAPTINSYKRLVPGYEAPVYSCWSETNRSAMIRVPDTNGDPKAARIELRCPDPSCNPYVAFSAMLAAGMDGIKKKLHVAAPVEDINVYELTKSERTEKGIIELPSSLAEAVLELEKDIVLMDALKGFGPKYLELLSKDAEEYRLAVTEWERERYYTK